jgi:hypothetical protein
MTPEQQAALRSQIHADPACAEALASRDSWALAAILSTGRTRTALVPIADVQAYLQTTGLWWAIKAVPPEHPAYAAAVAVIDVANARYQNIDTTLPLVGQMLGGLVATGVIAQENMDALMSMGLTADPVSALDVAEAVFNDDGSLK